ncbi:MAG: PrsW family glutamic-type intramembrane protease [Planctomycetaceae bacterium]
MLPLIALTFGADQVLASLFPVLGALLLAFIWAKPAWKSSLLVDFLVGGFLSHRLTLFVVSYLPNLFEGAIPMTSSEAWRCAFFEAAIPEEGVRFVLALAALQFLQVRRPSLPWEITAAQIALGFALFENLNYAQTEPGLRFMATLCHACDGLIMGAALYRWNQQASSTRWLWFAMAIAIPVVLHGLYDGTIMTWEMLDAVAISNPEEDSASDAIWVLMNIGVVLLELTLAVFILRSISHRQSKPVTTNSSSP